MGLEDFRYDAEHQVMVCLKCATCLVPGRGGPGTKTRRNPWENHLRAAPHGLLKQELKTMLALLSACELRDAEELQRRMPDPRTPCREIEGLATFTGYLCCCNVNEAPCTFVTRSLGRMEDHMPRHGRKPGEHKRSVLRGEGERLWQACSLQSYSTAPNRIKYFVVTVQEANAGPGPSSSPSSSSAAVAVAHEHPGRQAADAAFLNRMIQGVHEVKRGRQRQAALVGTYDRNSTERWLIHMGFPKYLEGLLDAEIRSSFQLPKKGYVDQKDEAETGDLLVILSTAESLFRDAYNLVSEKTGGQIISYAHMLALSNFAAGDRKQGKDIGFRFHKEAKSLVSYFQRMKELLVFFYRVAYREDGHFTVRAEPDAETVSPTSERQEYTQLPQEIIRPGVGQRSAMQSILDKLSELKTMYAWSHRSTEGDRQTVAAEEEKEMVEELKPAVRVFFMKLICHEFEGQPFQSPVLSFCAMLSRTKAYAGHRSKKGTGDDERDDAEQQRLDTGGWQEASNYKSELSKLVWMAQLLIFESVYHNHVDNVGDTITNQLTKLCEKFLHQAKDTAFARILSWRLYLSKVCKGVIASNQARWSSDGQEITYRGTTLSITEHIPQLILFQYQRAYALLFDTLLFGEKSLGPIQPEKLDDDLDDKVFNGSWLTHPKNAKLLSGADLALMKCIMERPDLKSQFCNYDAEEDQTKLNKQAAEVYEEGVQQFLQAIATLLHISPMPPMRAPELLSIKWFNTGSQRRDLFLSKGMLMLHVKYHKSREVTDKDRDNVRFVPVDVAELVLTFIAMVQPLRLAFRALMQPDEKDTYLSPRLFSYLDGKQWEDDKLSGILYRACGLAKVPQFKVAWWRQAAAAITKEKFLAQQLPDFSEILEDGPNEEPNEEEWLIGDLAQASNHSYATFNQSYAGSTTLATNDVIERARRASESWRALFGTDRLLAEEKARRGRKRAWLGESEEIIGSMSTYKKARLRVRPTQTLGALQAVARQLYNDPTMKFRQPGQRDAMIAMLGPRATDQVVAVLATGSGKTLLYMVGAKLAGAGITIVVVPTVALRENLLFRLSETDIIAMVWKRNAQTEAPVVLVSAEEACSNAFLEYAHKLTISQKLDRIVVDECHLTITANSFRRCMSELGNFVRQVQTQTVWLTATLPPDLEADFIKRNVLHKPHIVRESTNRKNIQYKLQTYRGADGLLTEIVALVQKLSDTISSASEGDDGHETPPGGRRARIIIYCGTKALMQKIAVKLDCRTYTGDQDLMSEEDKKAAINEWLGPNGSPAIVATSALGVGFDYPFVRWVIHAGPPRRLTDFSQESGRAGRDGWPAQSIVFLSAAWQPNCDQPPRDLDEELMQLYLEGKNCLRAVMSQYLDAVSDWRWCMQDEDELCSVCPRHHTERRPPNVKMYPAPAPVQEKEEKTEESASFVEEEEEEEEAIRGQDSRVCSSGRRGWSPNIDMVYTGPEAVLQKRQLEEEALEKLETGLRSLRGCCLGCRMKKKPYDHTAKSCVPLNPLWRAKSNAIKTCKDSGRTWIEPFTACYMCFMPQSSCSQPNPETNPTRRNTSKLSATCEFADMILPLCYGAFMSQDSRAFLNK
ncbi:hypothetical protein E4U30_007991, partial [Claviceps sp. LM220 group G6]